MVARIHSNINVMIFGCDISFTYFIKVSIKAALNTISFLT